ncbi:MAG: ribose 5-phosphate isomerase B [Anaerolineaceae bacterium]|nr:ribose 5-phosphate isomerase B [Anaerolineaceae bacterium]
MNKISDNEIRAIVEKVVRRTMGEASLPTPAPAVTNVQAEVVSSAAPNASEKSYPKQNVVAIGSDHGGFDMKAALKKELAGQGYEIIDVGTDSKESCDYPDFAYAVAQLVSSGKAWRGIAIDGAGIGSCVTANKVPGVRAGMAYDHATASNGREHNDTNVLTLGAGLIGQNLASQIVKIWLSTEFGGGRHGKRVDKIIAIEKKFLK